MSERFSEENPEALTEEQSGPKTVYSKEGRKAMYEVFDKIDTRMKRAEERAAAQEERGGVPAVEQEKMNNVPEEIPETDEEKRVEETPEEVKDASGLPAEAEMTAAELDIAAHSLEADENENENKTEAELNAVESALPEDMPEEEKKGFMAAVAGKWDSFKEKRIFGQRTGDVLFNMGVGASASVGAKYALRKAFSISMGAMGAGVAGAVGGAASGAAKIEAGAFMKRRKYEKVNKSLDEEPGAMLEAVKKGKLNMLDAVKIIADRKAAVTQETSDEEILSLLDLESKLITNYEAVEGLKGREKLEKYIELATSQDIESHRIGEGASEERMDDVEALSKEIALATGRHISLKDLGKASLKGAIYGTIGAELFELGHFAFDHIHIGSHDAVPTQVPGAADRANEAAQKLYAHANGSMKLELGSTSEVDANPLLGSFPHEHVAAQGVHTFGHVDNNTPVEAPHAPEELKVKGTVWGTVKSFFKAKGQDLNNDQLNDITRQLAHENHIGIAADHPAVGSYEVLDTKIADGTVLHGIDKIDLAHLSHTPVEAHAFPEPPHIPEIHIEIPQSPAEIAHNLGLNSDTYEIVNQTKVGDALNWIPDISHVGPEVDIAEKVFSFHPTGADMNLTVDEFFRQHIAASGALAKHIGDSIITPEMKQSIAKSVGESIAKGNAVLEHASSAAHTLPKMPSIDSFKPELTPSAPHESILSSMTPPHAAELPQLHMTPDTLSAHEAVAEQIPASKGERSFLDWLFWATPAVGLGAGAAVAGMAVNRHFNKASEESSSEEAPKDAESKVEEVNAPIENPVEKKELPADKTRKAILNVLFPKKVKPGEELMNKSEAAVLRKHFDIGAYGKFSKMLTNLWQVVPETEALKRGQIESAIELLGTLPQEEAKKAYREAMADLEELKTRSANQNTL